MAFRTLSVNQLICRLLGTLALAYVLAAVMVTGCRAPVEQASAPQPALSMASDAKVSALAATAPASPLADSEWRLVEIQSMDDAVGTARPNDPSRYTMRLNADGTVSMRLDCNRATGTWSAEAGPDQSSGRFEFGPLAGTRALCPAPSLDGRVTTQAPYVRSYLLKDGRLHLSLMADGGIYVFEPHAEVPFGTAPDKDVEPGDGR